MIRQISINTGKIFDINRPLESKYKISVHYQTVCGEFRRLYLLLGAEDFKYFVEFLSSNQASFSASGD